MMAHSVVSLITAYLAAGLYFALEDSAGLPWPETPARFMATLLAIAIVAALWAPQCARTLARYLALGWRPALAFLTAILPTLAMFLGAVLAAALL